MTQKPHQIGLNDFASAVDKAVGRALATHQPGGGIIMGRMVDTKIAEAEANKIASEVVQSLPAETKSQVTPEVFHAGPGHIIIGIIYKPAVLE